MLSVGDLIQEQLGCIVHEIATHTDDKASNKEDSIIQYSGL